MKDVSFDQKDLGKKEYTQFKGTLLVIKIITAFTVVYCAISAIYASFEPYSYTRSRPNYLHSSLTVLSQPIMDVFGYGRTSHFYDWREIDQNTLPSTLTTLKIRDTSNQKINYDSTPSKILSSFQKPNKIALIKPATHTGSWSLLQCKAVAVDSTTRICLQNNIMHSGSIRYSVDGDSELWGVDESDKPIVLTLSSYTEEDKHRDLILI